MESSSKNYIDYNDPYNYVIQWIRESEKARRVYQCRRYRTAQALQGKPSRNLYREEMEGIIEKEKNPKKKESMKTKCQDLPEGRSFALKKAVDNIANQMAGGVDAYEYQINDPYMIIDDDTEDLLATKCKQDYINGRMGEMASVMSRDLTTAGLTAWFVKYDPYRDLNTIFRINPRNTWWDTKYSATGIERFRGYSTMISYAKLKKMIEDDGDEINLNLSVPNYGLYDKDGRFMPREKKAKYSDRKIRSLNGLDIYVQSLNKLASSAQLPDGLQDYYQYDHDLHNCYNLNWYRSYATDPEQRTNNGYNGDDVELTIIYDLSRKIEFKVINRRFVISCNRKKFCRKIAFPIIDPSLDPEDPDAQILRPHIEDFHLECPLKFRWVQPDSRDIEPMPHAPVDDLLPIHDIICGWRAKREHVSRILAVLRIITNGADGAALEGVINVMGIVLPNIQGDIETLDFRYSYDPIDSEIAHLENVVQQTLHAYDQFDALQAMGDRASAAESGMALGAVAQGLAMHQNTIMGLYADIARQCIANRVAYSTAQEFPVVSHGEISSISIQQMALTATIDVKPALAKKIQEKMLSTNALTLLGTLGGFLNNDGIAYLVEQAMMGTAPRKLVKTFIMEPGSSPEEIKAAKLEAENMANQLRQNQQAYEQNPIPYEVDEAMRNSSPEEIDVAISELNEESNSGDSFGGGATPLEMIMQDGAMSPQLAGLTPDSGQEYANPNQMV